MEKPSPALACRPARFGAIGHEPLHPTKPIWNSELHRHWKFKDCPVDPFGAGSAKRFAMKSKLMLIGGLIFGLSSCDKPTSGQNTSEYRDGASGATSGTIMKDTNGGKTEPPEKNKD
jgi:hypothetical protein